MQSDWLNCPDLKQSLLQSSKLSSKFPKENPTAQGRGLPSDTAKVSATTFPDSNIQEPTGRTQKARPLI